MSWTVQLLPEVLKDLAVIQPNIRLAVSRKIDEVADNPLPQRCGGFGKELGKIAGINLSGMCKIKFKAYGLRVVYQLDEENKTMIIVSIGARKSNQVYKDAYHRKHE